MKLASRLSGVMPVLALALAALAAGGRVGAAIGGVGALLLLLGFAANIGALPLQRAKAQRTLPAQPVEAGADVEVRLVVDLPRLWPLLVLSLRDAPPAPLGPAPQLRVLAGGRRRVELSYRLHGLARGLHRFGSAILSAGDTVPVAPRRFALPCPGELLVHPQRVELDAPPPYAGAGAADRLPRGTRDFQPGDAPGRLHAARTAQRGYPQVREFEAIGKHPHILVLFAPRADGDDIELVLSCAASLAAAWLAAGEAVGLALAGASARGLPPQAGPEQEQRILAVLAACIASDLTAETPPHPPAPSDTWLLTTVPLFRQYPGRQLRIGPAAGEGSVLRLSDLPEHLRRREA